MLVSLIACALPSDPVPPPNAERANKVEGLRRALVAHRRGEALAAAGLVSGMEGLTRFPPAPAAIQSLAEALVAVSTTPAFDDRLAHEVSSATYELMNGGHLTRAQLNHLEGAIEGALQAAGVPAETRAAFHQASEAAAREEARPRSDWW